MKARAEGAPTSDRHRRAADTGPSTMDDTLRYHVVITGTGRAGTSFLVELLTHLGLETGFDPRTVGEYRKKTNRAGLEHDVRATDSPYVVKDPAFCDYAAEVLRRKDIAIRHVIVPMRDLREAVNSRMLVHSTVVTRLPPWKRLISRIRQRKVGGGLWDASTEQEQEIVLLEKVYCLLLALSDVAVPVTLLRFPRLAEDSRYLFQKLRPILEGTTFEKFQSAFAKTASPDLVHRFEASDS